ncbi:MAG: hypothetical protein CMI56_02640 [Parcubacteria group bacterium]|nr:hypothetical protein [Parcubacteria group bacterium]
MRRTRNYVPKKSVVFMVGIILLTATSLSFLATPQKAQAFEWGGQFQTVIPCFNAVIWTLTSGPRGGNFIWTPSTRTYENGPPSSVGQYGLGLAGPPYFCIVFPFPLVVFPGIIMTMVGTS